MAMYMSLRRSGRDSAIAIFDSVHGIERAVASARPPERPKAVTANQAPPVRDRNREIEILIGRVNALRVALTLTIQGLAAPISHISSDPEAANKSIENALAEGLRELADSLSEAEANIENAEIRMRASKQLLGELADDLSS